MGIEYRGQGRSCTSVIVGSQATIDGSIMIARNEDCGASFAPVVMKKHPAVEAKDRCYTAFNKKEFILPESGLAYSVLPEADRTLTGDFSSAGFNSAFVGMSATESIYGANRVLAYDPFVNPGIAEDAILDLVLPYIHSAREGVDYLGRLIQEHGSEEGNGVLFADFNEAWYMEIVSGHHYLAARIPQNVLALMPNQVSLEHFAWNDSENYIVSPGLKEFIDIHHLNPDRDVLNFRHMCGTASQGDLIYNTARAWDGMRRFAPKRLEAEGYGPESLDIPCWYTPERLVSVQDVMKVLGSHFERSAYDPLGRDGTDISRRKYRPIGVVNTQESHILQLFPGDEHPELRQVLWVSVGATAFAPHIPFFVHADDVPLPYQEVSNEVNLDQAYWLFRSLAHWSEFLRYDMDYNIEQYQREIICYTEARVSKIRKEGSVLPQKDVVSFLSKANAETAAEVMHMTKKHLTQLMKYGFGRSKLQFKMNTDL